MEGIRKRIMDLPEDMRRNVEVEARLGVIANRRKFFFSVSIFWLLFLLLALHLKHVGPYI